MIFRASAVSGLALAFLGASAVAQEQGPAPGAPAVTQEQGATATEVPQEIQASLARIDSIKKRLGENRSKLGSLLDQLQRRASEDASGDLKPQLKSFDEAILRAMDNVQGALDETSLSGDMGRQVIGLSEALAEERADYTAEAEKATDPARKSRLEARVRVLDKRLEGLQVTRAMIEDNHKKVAAKLSSMHELRPDIAFAMRVEKIDAVVDTMRQNVEGLQALDGELVQVMEATRRQFETLNSAGAAGG